MLETPRKHWQILQAVVRVHSENKAYNKNNHNPTRHTTRGEAVIGLLWRSALKIPQEEVIASGLPQTIGGLSKLLFLYDDFCDNRDQKAPPSIADWKKDPQLQQEVHAFMQAVQDEPISKTQKTEILRVGNRERYYQYRLQKEYAYHEEPLRSEVALTWREQAAGSFAQMFVKAANIQHGVSGDEAEKIVAASYWFGASIQLFDDIIDLGEDLVKGRQTPVRSLLWENSDEWKRVVGYFQQSNYSRIPVDKIPELAPNTFKKIKEERERYLQGIPKDPSYDFMRFLADPGNFPVIAHWYEKAFAVRSRQNVPILKLLSRLVKARA